MTSNRFYVYLHRRGTDGLVFYVGKGSGNRAFDTSGRNKYWHRVKEKYGFQVEIVFDELTEKEAFQVEIDTIKEFEYFGHPLTNMTTGGEGASGLIFSDVQRFNIANGLKNKRYKDKEIVESKVKRPLSFGINNHFSDKKVYTFIRLVDGLEVTCNRHELCETFGLKKSLLKKLFYKTNARKSAEGWKLKEIPNGKD